MLAKIEDVVNPAYLRGFDLAKPHHWWGLLARHPKEQTAADYLKEEGVSVYWPNYPRLSPTGGEVNGRPWRKPRLTSVIPGLMFVADTSMDACVGLSEMVERTPGLVGFFRNRHGVASALEDIDINIIRNIEAKLNLEPPPGALTHTFKVGQKVRFVDDLMHNWPPGRIGKLAKDGRISVDTPLLGRVVPIWVLPFQIEAM
jgi:hypothetical protein